MRINVLTVILADAKYKNKNEMDTLYLLQFACFLFMLVNILILGITRLHMKWMNRRYEVSRWLIIGAMVGLAIQFLLQMLLGFRAQDAAVGAVFNILVYPPCFSLISIGIYNIEATHANRRKMSIVCASIYAAILAAFCIGFIQSGNFHIGSWIYVMIVLFAFSVAYCIYMIIVEIRKRRRMLEVMAGYDILPYVRYARASVFMVFFPAVALPFAVLSTKSLYVIGPLGLLAVFFFTLSFMALGYNYMPTEELLDKEEEEEAAMECVEDNACLELQDEELDDKKETLQSQRSKRRQKIVREKLDEWCATKGYRDTSLNMITLSRSLNISRYELSRYLSSCLNTTFRPWLAEVRFEAAKKMMLDNPDFGNDIISAECGFSSRTHLYRMFKEKEGCSPTAWRERNC